MKLTRKALAALGIESDKIDSIVEMHTEVTDGMKETIGILEDENRKYKADAEKLTGVQKELDELKEQVAADAKNREGKDYDKLFKEFEDYKAEQEEKAVRASKEAAFKSILKDMKVSDDYLPRLQKYYKDELESASLDDKGDLSNTKDIIKSIKDEWGKLIPDEAIKGASTPMPPTSTGKAGGKTREEIDAIKNTSERQKAMAENPELYGIS